jgi:hypothetical protein
MFDPVLLTICIIEGYFRKPVKRCEKYDTKKNRDLVTYTLVRLRMPWQSHAVPIDKV